MLAFFHGSLSPYPASDGVTGGCSYAPAFYPEEPRAMMLQVDGQYIAFIRWKWISEGLGGPWIISDQTGAYYCVL